MQNTIATIAGGICLLLPQMLGESSEKLYIVLKSVPGSDVMRTEYVVLPPQDTGVVTIWDPRTMAAVGDRQKVLASVLAGGRSYHWLMEAWGLGGGLRVPSARAQPLDSVGVTDDTAALEIEVSTTKPTNIPNEPPLPSRKKRLEEGVRATVSRDVERYGITQEGAQELIMSLFDILVDKVETDEDGRINVYIKESVPELTTTINAEIEKTLKLYSISEQERDLNDSTKIKKQGLLGRIKDAAVSVVTTVAPGVEEGQMDKIVATLMSWLVGRNDRKTGKYRLWLGETEVERKAMMQYLHQVVTIPLLTQLKNRGNDKKTKD